MAKICVASIRYFYPAIKIELVKDYGNGNFKTKVLEERFDVQVVDLGVKKLGWSGAKFHYLYIKENAGKTVLMLDSDIVFIGPFLEKILPSVRANDYVVSIEEEDQPRQHWVRHTYFDVDTVKEAYPLYKFPGYFFNAGQMFLKVGSIDEAVLNEFFDNKVYPYWKNKSLFPLVDQSVYNYLLPTLQAEKKLKLGREKFMIWAGGSDAKLVSLEGVRAGNIQTGLIHWAGCLRTPYVNKMQRGDILLFFENYYYACISTGRRSIIFKRLKSVLIYYSKQVYYYIKPTKW